MTDFIGAMNRRPVDVAVQNKLGRAHKHLPVTFSKYFGTRVELIKGMCCDH